MYHNFFSSWLTVIVKTIKKMDVQITKTIHEGDLIIVDNCIFREILL